MTVVAYEAYLINCFEKTFKDIVAYSKTLSPQYESKVDLREQLIAKGQRQVKLGEYYHSEGNETQKIIAQQEHKKALGYELASLLSVLPEDDVRKITIDAALHQTSEHILNLNQAKQKPTIKNNELDAELLQLVNDQQQSAADELSAMPTLDNPGLLQEFTQNLEGTIWVSAATLQPKMLVNTSVSLQDNPDLILTLGNYINDAGDFSMAIKNFGLNLASYTADYQDLNLNKAVTQLNIDF